MEVPLFGARIPLFKRNLCTSCLRHSVSQLRTGRPPCPPTRSGGIRNYYTFAPTSSRQRDAHGNDHHTSTFDSSETAAQAYPLSGYYSDILTARSPYRTRPSTQRNRPTVTTVEPQQEGNVGTPGSAVEPQSPQDKMAIVFGTRLAGPGRSSRYDPGVIPPESTWKTINGVAIPPRPEEPDNCCMSGCVHCVWDDYRDEMEQWAARLEQAIAKGTTEKGTTDLRQTGRPEVHSAMGSMDDDGGGSETNWTAEEVAASTRGDELFAGIPVGIREFMKTEKMLKEKHRREGSNR